MKKLNEQFQDELNKLISKYNVEIEIIVDEESVESELELSASLDFLLPDGSVAKAKKFSFCDKTGGRA